MRYRQLIRPKTILLVVLTAAPSVSGTAAIYDGGAGCQGYGFQMKSFWLQCGENASTSELCHLEDGSMRVQASFTTEYRMPFAYYTLKIKACKWYGLKCIELPNQFEVDLCDVVNCEPGNHTLNEIPIILYGQEEDNFDYWQYHYGSSKGQQYTYEQKYQQKQQWKQQEKEYQGQQYQYQEQQDPDQVVDNYDPDTDQYGNTRSHNYFRNKWSWKWPWRNQQKNASQEVQDDIGDQYNQYDAAQYYAWYLNKTDYYNNTERSRYFQDQYNLSQFAAAGTTLSLQFTFVPYTEISYGQNYYRRYNETGSDYVRCDNVSNYMDYKDCQNETSAPTNADDAGNANYANNGRGNNRRRKGYYKNGRYYGGQYDDGKSRYANGNYNVSYNISYTGRYGRNYRYDNIVCSIPLKIVSDDFNLALWEKSSRYRNRQRIFSKWFTTVSMVGFVCLSAWGVKKRRLACGGCREDELEDGDSVMDDDARVTDFVLAGVGDSQPRRFV